MTKILTIEDDDNIRDLIMETLTLEKFEAIAAKNGRQGVELATKYLPDLIICDVIMPELDGYGVLQKLNRNPETRAIPFIFLTGKNTMDDFRQGMNLGANDYLTKPFTSEELVTAVKVRLQRYRLG